MKPFICLTNLFSEGQVFRHDHEWIVWNAFICGSPADVHPSYSESDWLPGFVGGAYRGLCCGFSGDSTIQLSIPAGRTQR
jgi:hypothetical protein